MDDLDLEALTSLLEDEFESIDDEQESKPLSQSVENKDPQVSPQQPTQKTKEENRPRPCPEKSTDGIEEELRKMQEKMLILQRQLEESKKSSPRPSSPKPKQQAPRRLVEVKEDLFFGQAPSTSAVKKEDCNKQNSISLVRDKNADSSDDENNTGLSDSGRFIKKHLDKSVDNYYSKRYSSSDNQPKSFYNVKKSSIPKNNTSEMDPYSGIRIINPVVSSTIMEARMSGRKMVKMSNLASFASRGKIMEDWVTIGVLVNKSEHKTTKNGKVMSIWKLTDLQNCEQLTSFFLFGETHNQHWKTSIGSVIGLLNPSFLSNKDGKKFNDDTSLTVDHPGKVMFIGTSKDLGTCQGKTKSGQKCTAIINKSQCEFCVYHVRAQYKKLSSKRAELQASYSGVEPKSLQQKILQKNQIMYGGQSYSSPVQQSTNKQRKEKEKLTLENLKLKRKAEDLERDSNKKAFLDVNYLSRKENEILQDVSTQSEFLGEALRSPGPGSRNFLKHLIKQEDLPVKEKSVSFITPKQLLKMHSQHLQELKNKSKVNALLKNSTSLTPHLGRNCSNEVQLDLSTSQKKKVWSPAEFAKLKAIQKIKENGPLSHTNPNEVKKRISPDKQEKILKKINSSCSSDKECSENNEVNADVKESKLEQLDINSKEFQKILHRKSSHENEVNEIEDEQQQRYFAVLEQKEQMETKMSSVKEMKCSVVSCMQCKYTAHQASDLCKAENHPVKHHQAVKRFFICLDCKHRTWAFTKIPKKSCRNCNGSRFERTTMFKPKEGPKLETEKLLIRGEEIKYIGSLK